jgi:hypothetical protein
MEFNVPRSTAAPNVKFNFLGLIMEVRALYVIYLLHLFQFVEFVHKISNPRT